MTLHASILGLAAPFLWLGYFLLIYGLNALACVQGWPRIPVIAAHLVLTGAALAVQTWPLTILARRRDEGGFYVFVGLGLGGLSLLATLMVGMMSLVVEPC